MTKSIGWKTTATIYRKFEMLGKFSAVCFLLTNESEDAKTHGVITHRTTKRNTPWPISGGDRTLAELSKQFGVHPDQMQGLKKHQVAKAENVFGAGVATAPAPNAIVDS